VTIRIDHRLDTGIVFRIRGGSMHYHSVSSSN